MEYITRILNLEQLLAKKSFFLFGPRATEKTSLIDHQLGDSVKTISLLNGQYFLRLSAEPWLLESMISADEKRGLIT